MSHKTALLTIAVIGMLRLMGITDLAHGHDQAAFITVRPVNTGQTYIPSLRLFRTPIAGRAQFITVFRVAILPFADLFASATVCPSP